MPAPRPKARPGGMGLLTPESTLPIAPQCSTKKASICDNSVTGATFTDDPCRYCRADHAPAPVAPLPLPPPCTGPAPARHHAPTAAHPPDSRARADRVPPAGPSVQRGRGASWRAAPALSAGSLRPARAGPRCGSAPVWPHSAPFGPPSAPVRSDGPDAAHPRRAPTAARATMPRPAAPRAMSAADRRGARNALPATGPADAPPPGAPGKSRR